MAKKKLPVVANPVDCSILLLLMDQGPISMTKFSKIIGKDRAYLSRRLNTNLKQFVQVKQQQTRFNLKEYELNWDQILFEFIDYCLNLVENTNDKFEKVLGIASVELKNEIKQKQIFKHPAFVSGSKNFKYNEVVTGRWIDKIPNEKILMDLQEFLCFRASLARYAPIDGFDDLQPSNTLERLFVDFIDYNTTIILGKRTRNLKDDFYSIMKLYVQPNVLFDLIRILSKLE